MMSDVHEGPLESAPALTAPAKKTRREARWERRRRRVWFEEVTGWILVPIILLAGYWVLIAILDGLGTSPSAIFAGINTILSGL
jgi:hypothetical protein